VIYSDQIFVRRLLTFHIFNFFSETTVPISTKLCRKHAWGMGIKICSNKGAGPYWDPIRCKIKKYLINLQKSYGKPLAGMHWYLIWIILLERRFNFVQIKSLWSCMTPPQGLKLLHSDI